jgi:predicted amidohydrolase
MDMSSQRRIKVAAIQMSLREGDVEGNAAKAHAYLDQAGREGVGLAVLPEMWWTGFSYRKLGAFADETPASLEEIGKIAGRYGMAVIGGWPERDGEKIYNAAFAIGPDGKVQGSYRKVHLFSPMKEDRFLSPGKLPVVFDLPFGKVGVVLCYDLRFPELVRRLALSGAELVAVPSQWPEARVDHFWTLLRARAIENQLFVVGANRAGKGGKITFGGHSGIIGPRGEAVAECGFGECVSLEEIDLDEVAAVREEICYLDERVPGVDDDLSPL